MRDRIKRIFATYQEGGTIANAIRAEGMKNADYYRALREHTDLDIEYREIQKARADMMVDEAYDISTDSTRGPQIARVQVDARIKIAGLYDRRRFGDKVQVELEAGPNITEAIEAGRRRLRPSCDPAQIIDVEIEEVPQLTEQRATDKQSAVPQAKDASDEVLDPFAD